MSGAVSLQKRIQQLKKAGADLPEVLYRTAKAATLRAVDAAQDATPPKAGTGRGPYIGVNMITGELKAHWATDSRAEPQRRGAGFVTELNNDMQYASYVNDGHRMDRHFVPGLYIDDNGLLSFDPKMAANRTGGLVVGAKTKYVKGEFMVDKAKEVYEKTCLDLLDKEIERLMR